jgi:hypothetical protein
MVKTGRQVVAEWYQAGRPYALEVDYASGRVAVTTDLDGWRVAVRIVLVRGRVTAAGLDVAWTRDTLPSSGLTRRVLSRVPLYAHVEAVTALINRPGGRRLPIRLVVPSRRGEGGRRSRARLSPTLADTFAGTDLATLPAVRLPRLVRAPRRRGRPPVSQDVDDARLVKAARVYADAIRRGSPTPTRDTQRALRFKIAGHARYLVDRARDRGILIQAASAGVAPKGDVDGVPIDQMTAKGLALEAALKRTGDGRAALAPQAGRRKLRKKGRGQ